jgi:hypoxanthine phosphoribosyltransferase
MRILINSKQLNRRVRELAARIEADYAPGRDEEDPLVCICVLKGSIFFFSDLLKELTLPLLVDFVQTSSYGGRGAQRGEVAVRRDVELPLHGRDVLIVEDVVDTGYTVGTLIEMLRLRGARTLRLCTLLDKPAARQIPVPIDYTGFTIENLYVVGYGLDHAERFRNLPHIAVWEPTLSSATAPRPPMGRKE